MRWLAASAAWSSLSEAGLPDYPVHLPNALLVGLLAIASEAFQFALPVALMTWRQPRRPHFGVRCMATLAFLMVAMGACNTLGWIIRLASPVGSTLPYVANFLSYSIYLCLLVAAVLLCFDTGKWNALLYATAGYTIQNLGTGAGELVRIVCEYAKGRPWGMLLASNVSNVAVLAVTGICYVLFIRKIRDAAPLRYDSRGMLGMVGAVIAVVIANDVVIRGLDNQWSTRVIPLPFLVTFRITHLVVCVFVLYAEYENLFNVRLRAEVAAQERIATERARQYELSRQNVQAVNARMHDVRHQVLRELQNSDAGIARGTLAEIARSITVYDAILHTGNEALDTILSEKQLQCTREGITLTCVADGGALDFMPAAEVYALFGSLLDAALALASTAEKREQRTVSLNVHRVGSLVSVHVSGACGRHKTTSPRAGNIGSHASERAVDTANATSGATGHRGKLAARSSSGENSTSSCDATVVCANECSSINDRGLVNDSIAAARAIVEKRGGTLTLSAASPQQEPGSFSIDALLPQLQKD